MIKAKISEKRNPNGHFSQSVSQSVRQSVCLKSYCSHASCNKCKQMKQIEAEGWTQTEIENSRRGLTSLLCQACKGSGSTKRSQDMKECAACRQSLGRTFFNGEDLKNQKKKEKAKATYTLVCISCKQREQRILDTIEELKANPCLRCHSTTWRHKSNCRAMKETKLRLSRNDLEWLKFRPKIRSSAFVTDIEYYEAIGVLIP